MEGDPNLEIGGRGETQEERKTKDERVFTQTPIIRICEKRRKQKQVVLGVELQRSEQVGMNHKRTSR
jgi:hypothetical protein